MDNRDMNSNASIVKALILLLAMMGLFYFLNRP